ncbi:MULTISPECIES: cyclic lactone autoinducer peptide [unclassified Clostridioides]|nr:cyclic lactone autoinducer peptide [Clostridioides sp. ZZV14-6150]MCC0723357.1 cyclic lactone autoinducer peptide [Clostridioides sp. ZZV14-6104]MCC0742774.1 cyclic lactone autoinducer peptide [Clostridioides sp. ZZV14-6044]MCC0751271.1 cyclic lactone autoinducer peptide [Clostridioides sp. ZZV13-5731]
MKKITSKLLQYTGKLSICILTISANTTSNWLSHQPKIPDGVNKFKKR